MSSADKVEAMFSKLIEMQEKAKMSLAEYEEKQKGITDWVKQNNRAIRELLPIVGKVYELKTSRLYHHTAKYIKVKPSRVLSKDSRLYGVALETWPIPMVNCVLLDCDYMPIMNRYNDSVSLMDVGGKVTPSKSCDKGGVYLIRVKDTNLHKIGVANDAKKRLTALQTASPFELELLTCYQVFDPYDHEKKLHRYFERQRTQGEWFNLDHCSVTRFHEYFSA